MDDDQEAPEPVSEKDIYSTDARPRLHGADRSGLGMRGWSETPDDLIGRPDDSNIASEFYDPLEAPSQRDIGRAMQGVRRRARAEAKRH
jgi:hypothetical protein